MTGRIGGLLVTLAVVGLVVAAAPTEAQGEEADDLLVEITPVTVDVTLGQSVDITVSVTNRGASPTGPLAVHLDITDPTSPGSVDPEDWTATLTRPTEGIEPGASRSVAWTLHPISSGEFIVYAVALAPGTADVHATASAIDFAVAHQRALNPGGVLPIALAVPALVGAVLVGQWRLTTRRSPPTPGPPSGSVDLG